MIDNPKLYRDFMHVSHFLRHGHGDPAFKVAPGQHRVLTVLIDVEGEAGLPQRDLGAQMGLSPAALSELLAKLEDRGLVKRERSQEDRRVTLVSLTAKGRKQAQSLVDAEARVADDTFGALDDADREKLASILAKMISNWEGAE